MGGQLRPRRDPRQPVPQARVDPRRPRRVPACTPREEPRHHDRPRARPGRRVMARSLRVRFYPKPLTNGRTTVYGVYDRVLGGYWRDLPGFGRVKQDHPTEAAAQAEADRLAAFHDKD